MTHDDNILYPALDPAIIRGIMDSVPMDDEVPAGNSSQGSPQAQSEGSSNPSPGVYQSDTQRFAGNIIRNGSALYRMYNAMDGADEDQDAIDFCKRNHRPIC